MRSTKFIYITLLTLFCTTPALAGMDDYCMTPPFLNQTIAPNVFVVLDNSGSMCGTAYPGTYNPSQFSNGLYYGYFEGDKNYRYNGSAWEVTNAPMTSGTRQHPIAKGNLLNWALMRRVEVAKKLLIGGKATPRTPQGSQTVKLYGETTCNNSQFNHTIQNAAGLIYPFSGRFRFDRDVSGNFTIVNPNNSADRGGPYRIVIDQGQTKAEGVIDTLASEVRFGLGYYNPLEGGRVANYVQYNAAANIINSIHGMVPNTWTPLAETLFEVVRYFRQDTPQYSAGDYKVGSGNFSGTTIYNDPYAYKFQDVDGKIKNQYVPCAKSFILFLTDGESTKDQSIPAAMRGYSRRGGPDPRYGGTPIGKTYGSEGTDYMIDIAYWARTEDMRPPNDKNIPTPTSWSKNLPGIQNIITYPVFMFGYGSSMLKDVAIYGGFKDINGNNKPDCNTIPAECYRDSNNDGIIQTNGTDFPLTYYEGSDGYRLEQDIKEIIRSMIEQASSGTAASALGSSQGSGANMMQALLYPKRTFALNTEATWIGDLMNYWYYLDPYLKNAQIREDTVRESADYSLLDLKNDRITAFTFDAASETTVAKLCHDANGNSICDPGETLSSVPIEDAKAIWRAGVNLWWADPDNRRIWTTVNGAELTPFVSAASDTLDDYMGLTAAPEGAKAVIEYVRGKDYSRLCSVNKNPCNSDSDCLASNEVCTETRNRTVSFPVCSQSKTPCTDNASCPLDGETCAMETHAWKLGDMVSSTPRIIGPSPLNNYHVKSPRGYGDTTYNAFIKTQEYAQRGQVLVGANDGMLHAFKLGTVSQKWADRQWYQAGRIDGRLGAGGVGTESWAFVPKNVLPYLQYLSQKNYNHIYMVDGPIRLTDASVGVPGSGPSYWDIDKTKDSWRTIAIASMGIGGATSSTADASRIQIPLQAHGAPVGWSAYFAFDVTDPDNPSLLWEFPNTAAGNADPGLGVTNIGPAIVKTGSKDKNGRWFAILASGSTGPINTANDSFQGTSNQNLKLFVLDLKTGELLRTIDTGIQNAFAGSLGASAIDLERNSLGNPGSYQDDVVYIGYVKDVTKGGILRLVIDDESDPNQWTLSTVIDDIGPVTTSVANLLDRRNKTLWLYFAEGRYFNQNDDLESTRRLYGIKELCYTNEGGVELSCATKTAFSTLKDQSNAPSVLTSSQTGWYITMDPATANAGAQRVISNPTPDPLGAIYFISFMPTTDVCGFGGTTYVWSLDYKSGMRVTYERQGFIVIQTSTGAIKELDLSDPNTFSQKDGRMSEGIVGVPPPGDFALFTNPPPVKEFMNIQEQ